LAKREGELAVDWFLGVEDAVAVGDDLFGVPFGAFELGHDLWECFE